MIPWIPKPIVLFLLTNPTSRIFYADRATRAGVLGRGSGAAIPDQTPPFIIFALPVFVFHCGVTLFLALVVAFINPIAFGWGGFDTLD